jgi:hypothetical protein
MSTGQNRVLVLLIVLFALEAVVHPGIKQWVALAINGWNSTLGGAIAKAPDKGTP